MQGLRPELLKGVPDNVYRCVRQLEDSFTVGTPGLKIVTNHFVKELEKGSVPWVPICIRWKAEARIKALPWREAK
ncbi:hypothetical protein PHISCL_10679 [Aspergillus sclerotialis]|uniref:Uncharacterized protein n=1 Tax=Aspergillus sclerotialis TaxID=2070753 RepID=A0A3A2ZC82_9EURO|nr:hypothetical protein PHISCL_10679 [Aspergillus sclerotialis]